MSEIDELLAAAKAVVDSATTNPKLSSGDMSVDGKAVQRLHAAVDQFCPPIKLDVTVDLTTRTTVPPEQWPDEVELSFEMDVVWFAQTEAVLARTTVEGCRIDTSLMNAYSYAGATKRGTVWRKKGT